MRVPIVMAAVLGVAACSKTPPTASAAAPNGTAAGAQTASAPTGSVCNLKLLDISDVDGILEKPVTGTKPLQGDTQTCYFTTGQAMAKVKVSLRPGLGDATLTSYTSGHMGEFAKWQALNGVGDKAVWKPQLNEVTATKNNVLCETGPEAGAMFLDPQLRQSGKAYERLGALCNKVFAGYFKQSAGNAPIALGTDGNVLETACVKRIRAADVADLFNVAVTPLAPNSLNPQACGYEVPGRHARIDIIVASGEDAQNTWQMLESAGGQPYPGLGDKAMHRGETTLWAMRGNVLCTVDLSGIDNAEGMGVLTKARGDELLRKLGALCLRVLG